MRTDFLDDNEEGLRPHKKGAKPTAAPIPCQPYMTLMAQDLQHMYSQPPLIASSLPAQWHTIPAPVLSPGAPSPLYCLTQQVLVSTDKLIHSEVPGTKNSWR